jgi:hypothetical protein
MRTYGVHSKWDSSSSQLPRLIKVTTRIPARVDIEFGFVVNIKGAKNTELDFCIDHPEILDADGTKRDPFDGTVFIKTNDWNFYLGDTIWEPITDKLGDWRMFLKIAGNVIADKTFQVYDDPPAGEAVADESQL